ncbi:MAG: response regulator [Planctomycetes bacterium]|nr:response regulator [Planctomycetota bacterium]
MATQEGRVLVVDDEAPIRTLLASVLAANGYEAITTPDARRAMLEARSQAFAAAIVDVRMPGTGGIELSRSLRAGDPDLPVIIITGYADSGTAREAIRLGAYDYITKPFDLNDVVFSLARAIERRALLVENREYRKDLEAKVEQRTRDLSEAMARLEGSLRDIQAAHIESIFVLSRVTELNDEYTGNHIRRVSRYCAEIARRLGCSPEFVEQITYSSPMHDIGKISIPSNILGKPGKLTSEEFEVVKQHTVNGARILEGIPFLSLACEIALSHHERFDGTGYPNALRGGQIPLTGRIVAVADVFDALISRRPYKEPYSFEQSIEIMSKESGKHFDPQVLGAFLGIRDNIRQIAAELSDGEEPPDAARGREGDSPLFCSAAFGAPEGRKGDCPLFFEEVPA